MVGWHHRLDGHEFEQALDVGEANSREAWHAAVHAVAKSRTQLSDRRTAALQAHTAKPPHTC